MRCGTPTPVVLAAHVGGRAKQACGVDRWVLVALARWVLVTLAEPYKGVNAISLGGGHWLRGLRVIEVLLRVVEVLLL